MNTKKIFTTLFILSILFIPIASDAQQNQQGIHEPGTGLGDPELKQINQGTGQGVQNQNEVQNQGEADIINLQQNAEAGQKGIHEPGTGLGEPQLKQINQGIGRGSENQNERAVSRRSRVANSVQEMEKIATRNQGIGDQVRVIAQNQNKNQEEAENALETAQKRSGFARFFIGPNYGQLKTVEEKLENHTQNLSELKELRNQIYYASDQTLLDEQIEVMEQIKQELENEVLENKKGFSLFGWLAKILAK